MATLGTAVELINADHVRFQRNGDLFTYGKVLDVSLGRSELVEGTTNGSAVEYYGTRDMTVDFEVKLTTPEIHTFLGDIALQSGLASTTTWEIIYPSLDSAGATKEAKLSVIANMARGLSINHDEEQIRILGTLRITSDVTSASVS